MSKITCRHCGKQYPDDSDQVNFICPACKAAGHVEDMLKNCDKCKHGV